MSLLSRDKVTTWHSGSGVRDKMISAVMAVGVCQGLQLNHRCESGLGERGSHWLQSQQSQGTALAQLCIRGLEKTCF